MGTRKAGGSVLAISSCRPPQPVHKGHRSPAMDPPRTLATDELVTLRAAPRAAGLRLRCGAEAKPLPARPHRLAIAATDRTPPLGLAGRCRRPGLGARVAAPEVALPRALGRARHRSEVEEGEPAPLTRGRGLVPGAAALRAAPSVRSGQHGAILPQSAAPETAKRAMDFILRGSTGSSATRSTTVCSAHPRTSRCGRAAAAP
jgi:hypothetical protein